MNAENEGRAEAEAFRREHKLGDAPLPDLVSLIELTQDIDVAVLDAEPDEHGMTMRDPDRDVVMVAVARTRNPMRQRSTLAHELGHVLFGDFAPPKADGWDERSPQEIRADAFARHLLVPRAGIEAAMAGRAGSFSLPEFSIIVQRFKASPSLIALQLFKTDLISAARMDELKALSTPALASRFGWSDLYAGWQQESQQRRAPQRLLSRATEGYLVNVLSLQAIARLRGLPVEMLAEEFEQAGIMPAPIEPVAAPPIPSKRQRRPDTDFGDLDALEDAAHHPAEGLIDLGRDSGAPGE
jgi:Zn-dependent peptidase ImmA (M78 family)